MDPTAIAVAAITILSPYLSKAGEEIAKNAAQAAWKKAADIYQAIKTRFEKEEDDYPSQTLLRFEANPEKRKGTMQDVLEEILAEDADFAKALLVQLEDADKAGVGTVFNVNIFGGEVGEIINIDKLEGGLTITKTSKSQNPEKYESSGNTPSSGRYSLLLENLVRYFSINDLRTISFELGLDYENLKGDTKQVLARELISYCEHRGQIPDLVAVCKEQRPRVEKWI